MGETVTDYKTQSLILRNLHSSEEDIQVCNTYPILGTDTEFIRISLGDHRGRGAVIG